MFLRRLPAALLIASLHAATVEQLPAPIPFIEPFGVAIDDAANTWVIEYKGNRLIRLSPHGDATIVLGDAAFREPHGVVINRAQQLFVADTHNNRVLRLDLPSPTPTVIAGNGQKGFNGDNGPATQASFNGIYAIDLSPDSRFLFLADLANRRIRRVHLDSGIVTTIAGNGNQGVPTDGAPAAQSPLVDPRAVTADQLGNVFILERAGNALRMVDPSGAIRTLIKPGDLTPNLNGPKHLCLAPNGDIIIADAENHLVRRYLRQTGQTITIAGTGEKGAFLHPTNPLKTQLNRPHGVYVHSSGALYITDSYNHRILKVTGY
jgi:hypothetical protein